MGILGFFTALIGFGLIYIWPIYASLKSLQSLSDDKVSASAKASETTQWIAFWVIHTLLSLLENNVMLLFYLWIPLFAEIRVAAYAWLVLPHPTCRGAKKAWAYLEAHGKVLLTHPMVKEAKMKAQELIEKYRPKSR